MKKVSIIITIYNNSLFLDRCLKSIINQTYPPYEIILVDDGSKDNESKKIYLKYKNNKIKFYYFKKKNEGPSAARNFGMKKVKCGFVCFFDPDDLMERNFIKKKIDVFLKNKERGLFGVYSNIKFISTSKKEEKILKYKNGLSDDNAIDSIGYQNGICGSIPCYLFCMPILKKKLTFDNNIKINEDFDFIIRFLKNRYKVYGINLTQTIVHLTENSLTRSKKNQKLIYNH